MAILFDRVRFTFTATLLCNKDVFFSTRAEAGVEAGSILLCSRWFILLRPSAGTC